MFTMTSHSEKQETIDDENSENQNSSNEDKGIKWSLDMLRTCPLALIRSDPRLRIIYDRGFVSGFYGEQPKESTVVSVPKQYAEAEAELAHANPALALRLGSKTEKLAMIAAMDSAVESALNTALEVAEHSSMAARLLTDNDEEQ
ncbi:uncharacterized protein LOC111041196 [Myzus persicae]|uniref:uncharacterized protein LOC111041196 n=1 Tax=Myzus persicae TaxID=13164 RepID=UPI000B932366|nr:uncharacterized protein LOC111041196 [Myzus persicae]